MNVNVFCDVDGVLNRFPVAKTNPNTLPTDRFRKYDKFRFYDNDGHKYKFTYSRDAVPLLENIFNSENVTFYWFTTWFDVAVRVLDPVYHIKNSRVLSFLNRDDDWAHVEKNVALKRAYSAGVFGDPFIWLDDVATAEFIPQGEDSVLNSASVWDVFHVDSLVIKPDERVGVTADHIALMNDFIKAHK